MWDRVDRESEESGECGGVLCPHQSTHSTHLGALHAEVKTALPVSQVLWGIACKCCRAGDCDQTDKGTKQCSWDWDQAERERERQRNREKKKKFY